MRWHPKGYGGERRSPEEVKREGWREQGLLVVSPADPRLTWPERELIRQLAAQMAAELGVEAHPMQKILETHVRAHLAELAEVRPEFR